MNIYVIIVSYNGMYRDWINKCLTSLRNSIYKVNTIVVDNKSTDETCDFIRKNFREVDLITSPENLGFGKANNLGMSKALQQSADAVFLLNQDAWIAPEAIEILVNISKKYPDFGILSPLQLDGTGERLEWGFSNSIGHNYNKDFFSDFVLNKPKKEVYETTETYAASWYLTKDCLRLVGGFNPSFFHYGEDTNYIQRVQHKGLKMGVTPLTHMCHDAYEKQGNNFLKFHDLIKRSAIENISNPAGEGMIKKDTLKRFKIKIYKSLLLRDKESYKEYKTAYDYVKANFDVINNNRSRSVSEEEFVFLK